MADTAAIQQKVWAPEPLPPHQTSSLDLEFKAIGEEAETYFKRPDVEADWKKAIKQPEYLALVERFKAAAKADEDAHAGRPKTAMQLRCPSLFWSSARSWCYHSIHAYKKINTSLNVK